MKSITIKGALRTETGSKNAQDTRREGNVPGVIYGGDKPVHFFADERELNKAIYTPSVYLVKLDLDGTEYTAIMQATQFHPVTDRLMHVDFLEVTANKVIKVKLPVRTEGTPVGVRNGGRLGVPLKKLKVAGLSADIPDEIELNVAKLRIGQSIRIGDLNFKGITFLDDARLEVCGVKAKRGVVDTGDDEEAEGAEGAETEATAEAAAE